MNVLKESLITALRNKSSSRNVFRRAAYDLTHVLAHEAINLLKSDSVDVQTPLAQTKGVKMAQDVLLVPILRSGLVFLPAFMQYLSGAAIGIVGIRRDEQSAQPILYYTNMPSIASNDTVIILDPMIATGGTATAVLTILVKAGVKQNQIIFVAVISACEGVEKIRSLFPDIKLLIAAEDKELNDEKFIVPGLGDFGDRFFGTE